MVCNQRKMVNACHLLPSLAHTQLQKTWCEGLWFGNPQTKHPLIELMMQKWTEEKKAFLDAEEDIEIKERLSLNVSKLGSNQKLLKLQLVTEGDGCSW